MLRRSSGMVMVFMAATLWGQSSGGPLATPRQMVAATSNAEGLAAANRARAAANQNLMELGNALTRMEALLKEMRAQTNRAGDPVAKANLELWTLMLDQLDKQYEQLRIAARQREDLEARRAALYKQADEKAGEAARRAKASKAAAAASNASIPTPATPSATSTTGPRPASSFSPN
jgi:chemotaxis protein histidine kinase CheA